MILPFLFLSGLLLSGIVTLSESNKLISDEIYHFDQIQRFLDRNPTLNPNLTTIPGYEIVMSLILSVISVNSVASVRLLSLITSLGVWLTFFAVAHLVDPKHAYLKTLQLAWLPLILPFSILIYTDVFSLLLVLAGLWLTLDRHYWLAGLTVTASLAVRQNNIIWLFGFWLILLSQEIPESRHAFLSRMILRVLHKSLFFGVGAFCFFLFLYLKGGVALAQKEMHPLTFWHFGNIYYFLFVFAVLFWPQVPTAVKKVAHWPKKLWLVFVPLFFFYQSTFVNDHFHNGPLFSEYLRNRILMTATSNSFTKSVFFLFIFFSLLIILTTKMAKPIGYLIWPVTILIFLASWFIDPRYYLVTLALFILFRRSGFIGQSWSKDEVSFAVHNSDRWRNGLGDLITVGWFVILGIWILLKTMGGELVI